MAPKQLRGAVDKAWVLDWMITKGHLEISEAVINEMLPDWPDDLPGVKPPNYRSARTWLVGSKLKNARTSKNTSTSDDSAEEESDKKPATKTPKKSSAAKAKSTPKRKTANAEEAETPTKKPRRVAVKVEYREDGEEGEEPQPEPSDEEDGEFKAEV